MTSQTSSDSTTMKTDSTPENKHEKMLAKQTIHKFQKICKNILIITCIAFLFLFYKLYLFQQKIYGPENQLNHFKDFITYGIFFSVAYTAIDFLLHYYCEELVIKHFMSLEKYPTRQSQQKRAYSIVKWGYSIIFYGSCAFANYWLLSQTSYPPEWLGGKSGFREAELYFLDDSQNTFPIKILYMIEFGKHFSRLIIHAFIKQEGNYFQFTLHHMLSVALIVFSYLSNVWLAGLIVLITHDGSDALLLIARFYKDYKKSNPTLTNILGAIGVLSWIVFRGVLFLYYLVYPVFDRYLFHPIADKQIADIIYWPSFYISMMLWALLAMDYVWIFALIKALFALVKPSQQTLKKDE